MVAIRYAIRSVSQWSTGGSLVVYSGRNAREVMVNVRPGVCVLALTRFMVPSEIKLRISGDSHDHHQFWIVDDQRGEC